MEKEWNKQHADSPVRLSTLLTWIFPHNLCYIITVEKLLRVHWMLCSVLCCLLLDEIISDIRVQFTLLLQQELCLFNFPFLLHVCVQLMVCRYFLCGGDGGGRDAAVDGRRDRIRCDECREPDAETERQTHRQTYRQVHHSRTRSQSRTQTTTTYVVKILVFGAVLHLDNARCLSTAFIVGAREFAFQFFIFGVFVVAISTGCLLCCSSGAVSRHSSSSSSSNSSIRSDSGRRRERERESKGVSVWMSSGRWVLLVHMSRRLFPTVVHFFSLHPAGE